MDDGRNGAAMLTRADERDEARRRALIGICTGYALVILDANVLNVAAPALRESLGASPEGLLWVIDAYTLAFAAFLLSAGALGDRLGVRKLCIAGLAVFTLASLACSLSRDAVELSAARAVQGLGAALLAPTSIALIRELYSETGARARAFAVWSAISGIGFALGPLCGGALVTQAGWPSIFLINIPFGLAAMVLIRGARAGERPERSVRAPLDPFAQILAALALGGLTLGLIETADGVWLKLPVIGTLAGAALIAALFGLREFQKDDPDRFVPFALLRPSPVVAGLVGGAAFNFSLYGLLFALTLALQGPGGFSPAATGAVFLPLTVSHAVVAASATGRLMEAHGPRLTLVAGLAFCGAGAAFCAGTAALAGRSDPTLGSLLFGLGLFGIGSGLSTAPLTVLVLSNLPDRAAGIGAGVLNASRQVGGLVGVALLGSLTIADPRGMPLAAALALVTIACGGGMLACLRTRAH